LRWELVCLISFIKFAPEGIQFTSFALFIAIAMSITAFPVLARIVQERNLQKTKRELWLLPVLQPMILRHGVFGSRNCYCKAGSFESSLYVILMAIAYVFFMIKIVRPFLKRIGDLQAGKSTINKPMVAIFFDLDSFGLCYGSYWIHALWSFYGRSDYA
jgi:Kef-type K+ transport system membrane component KefB